MKKMNKKKSKKITFKQKIKNKLTSIKDYGTSFKNDPIKNIKEIFRHINLYIKNNKYFFTFVVINVLNALLLRYFTLGGIHTIFSISPFLSDLAFLIIIGSFGYLMNEKRRVIYYIALSFIFTLLCTINSSYYTFYTSFSSLSLLPTTKYIFSVGDAVVENVIKIRDIIYPTLFIILVICYIVFAKEKKHKQKSIIMMKKTFVVGAVTAILFMLTLTAVDIGRLVKQWNREYIVSKYGIYVYHVNDLFKSIEPKLTSLFGYDKALKKFNEYYVKYPEENIKNEYTNTLKGKNVIGIHLESIQNFVIGLKINGEEVTPNLNKLANSGFYFNNFYTQVSVGTSSDTEFTLATSLMPSNTGTAFGSYFDRTYIALPQLLKDQGYYTFAMHGNNADYWNRRIMHKNLGYDHFYAKSEFDIDETIGLGLSDCSFFRQAIQKLEVIDKEYDKYYGTFIMLTNHTPFSETDKYGEFDVSKTINGIKYPYMEDTKLGNYLKSVHYADKALGEFITGLEEKGLLENTVIVLYGDHDARLPIEDYQRFYNYDYKNDDTLEEDNPKYKVFDDYDYELNRKVPLIIWSKDAETKTVDSVMGMYDLMPTLGNMLGVHNKYVLGQDIFNHLNDNIVVFPTGNWITDKVYYNNQRDTYKTLNNSEISQKYIDKYNKYSDDLLDVSNAIIVYDLISKVQEDEVNETELLGDSK